MKALEQAIIAPMVEIADSLGMKPYYRAHKNFLRIGSQEFVTWACDNKNSDKKLFGFTIHSGLFDEVALWSEPFYDAAMSRISYPDSLVMQTCNPASPSNFVKKKLDAGYYDFHREFDFDDNPILADKVKDEYRSSFSGIFHERMIKGQWVDAENRIFPFFRVDKNPRAKVVGCRIGVDVGTASPSALVPLQKLEGNQFYIPYVEKIEGGKGLDNTTDDELVEQIDAMATRLNAECVIFDPSALRSIQTAVNLAGRKWDIRKANNSVIPGIRHLSDCLKNFIRIHPEKAKLLIDELLDYRWQEDREAPIKIDDHFTDATRYVAMDFISRTDQKALKIPDGYWKRQRRK